MVLRNKRRKILLKMTISPAMLRRWKIMLAVSNETN